LHRLGSAALGCLINVASATLGYLPPHSPDLNPIEQTFAKIKHCMRNGQKRTIDDAWQSIRGPATAINARMQ
jgi:putative transposase